MAIDPKHLPEDPKSLQQMVLDLMTQLDREFSERSKLEALLRELLDAKRSRKSEQLSDEQLALFAALWQQRQTEREAENPTEEDDDDGQAGQPGVGTTSAKKRGGRQACHAISSASASCMILPKRKSTVSDAGKICGRLARRPANAMSTFRLRSR